MRHAPSETQTHIAFITAIIGVAVVASIWVIALPARFADAQKMTAEAAPASTEEDVTHEAGADESLGAVLKQFTASTTEAVKDLNTALKEPSTENTIIISDPATSTSGTSSDSIIKKETE